jgi:hypothetical protein
MGHIYSKGGQLLEADGSHFNSESFGRWHAKKKCNGDLTMHQ